MPAMTDAQTSSSCVLLTHADCREHRPGDSHPEAPARLDAVLADIERSGLMRTWRRADAPLATREELHTAIAAAVAPLATRDEMHAAIAAAIAPLATRDEMRAEGDHARRHATMLFEDLRDDNRLILEHLLALSARVDELARR